MGAASMRLMRSDPAPIPPTGIELTPLQGCETAVQPRRDVNSDALSLAGDPSVVEIATHWPSLPKAIKNAVLALVRSCRDFDGVAVTSAAASPSPTVST
jgi:hypothetical protein